MIGLSEMNELLAGFLSWSFQDILAHPPSQGLVMEVSSSERGLKCDKPRERGILFERGKHEWMWNSLYSASRGGPVLGQILKTRMLLALPICRTRRYDV